MSNSVDERIVEMRFNNKQFEEGISESTKSLENLKKSLKLEDAAQGLKNVEESGKKFNLDNVANAIELVSSKFSILGTIGDQIIRTLTDKFMGLADSAIKATKSLSIDQISAGWEKYENKTEAVQTIMNATGKDIEEVNEQLEKLQWFTDETSYNFVDMTSSIADFTNANVELEDAVNAMMGIANWAAVSGGNVQQAGIAMRNLSQAMSMDKVLVTDWMSIEKAGMATMEFKQNVIDTAVELGYLRDMGNGVIETMGGAEVTAEGFRGTLEEGWFSGKVLTETLKKYSEYTNAVYEISDSYDTCAEAMEHVSEEGMELSAKAFKAGQQYKTFKDVIDATKDAVSSGWMTTFELIFGNMEEAKSLWTDVGGMFWDIFASGAETRNEILQGWRDMDGWEHVTDSIWSVFRAFESLRDAAREGWQQVFPKMTSERLFEITGKINKFFNKVADWAKDAQTVDRISRIFKGLGSALQLVKKIAGAIITPIKRVTESIKESGGSVLELTAKFFDLFTKLNESEKFQEILDKISAKIGDVLVWVVGFIQKIKQTFSDARTYFEPVIEKFKEGFEKIKQLFSGAKEYFSTASEKIGDAFDNIKEKITNFGHTDTSSSESVFDKLKKAAEPFKALFEGIKKGFEFVWGIIKKIAPLIGSVIKFIGDALGQFFGGLQSMLRNGDLNGISEILGSGVLGALVLAIKSLFGGLKDLVDDAGSIIDGIKGIFGALQDSLQSFSEKLKAKALKELALAIGILAVSVLILSAVDPGRLESALNAILELFVGLMISLKSLSGSNTKMKEARAMKKTMESMVAMAAAVLVLAIAMKKIGDLDGEQIKNGILAIGGLMLELLAFSKIMSKGDAPKKMMSTAIGLILLAVAIRLLVGPMKELGEMDPENLTKGIIAIGAVLTELALFTKLSGGQKKMISIGIGLIEVAAALKIISSVIGDIGQLSWEEIAKGLVGIAVSIASIALAMKLMPKGSVLKGAGFVIVAAGLKIIASVMNDISSLSWGGVAKGLVSVAVALTAITVAMNMMPNSAIIKAAGLVVVGAGLKIIASVMNDISVISWEGIAKGLVVMGSALMGIALAMQMMPTTSVVSGAGLVIVAAGLKIIASVMSDLGSLSFGEIVKGLTAMGGALMGIVLVMNQVSSSLGGAAALLVVAVALNTLVPVMQGLGALSWTEILKALAALAGVMGVLAVSGKLIDPFANAIVKLGAGLLLIAAAAAVFAAALSAIAVAIEILASTGEVAVHAFLGALGTILTALPELLRTLAISIKNSASSIVEMISTIIGSILLAIGENVPKIVDTVLDVILQVLTSLVDKAPAIIEKILTFVLEIFKGLREYVPQIAEEVIYMFKAIIESLSDAIGGLSFSNLVKVVAELAGLGAILAEIGVIAAIGLVTTAMLPPIGKNLNKFMDAIDPFLEKIQKVDSKSLIGAEALGNTVLALTKASILDALTSWFRGDSGGMVKFGEEIAQLGPYIAAYSDSIDGINADAVLKSALAAQAIAEFANNIPKHGGLKQLITGDTNLIEFVEGLVQLGPALNDYAVSVKDLDSDAVTNSITAASVISAFADNLPRHGGFVQAIVGDNSLNEFAQDLTVFGPNLKAYADSVTGLKADVVISSANAAEAISELANGLPNSGGVVAFFAGDNSLSDFGQELAEFGPLFAQYGEAIADIKPEVVEASANAAAALFAVANNVPNQGGVVSWFAGDNKLSDFATGLIPFGKAMDSYSKSVENLKAEPIVSSADAAAAIFEVAAMIPNQGGVVSWFAGDNKIGDFAAGLIPFGEAMLSYSESVKDLKCEAIKESAMAALSLFEAAAKMPNQGGVISWFAGDNKIGDFAEGLKPFGEALKSYGESVDNLNNDDISAATTTIAELFDVAAKMPNQGGIISWFAGDNKLSTMGDELKKFGPKFADYAKQVEGISVSGVSASGRALKVLMLALHEMPNQGGVVSWFAGDNTLGKIGKDLEIFGPSFSSYAESVRDFPTEGVDASIKSLKLLFEALHSMPDQGGIISWFTGDNTLGKIGKDLAVFAPQYVSFTSDLQGFDQTDIENVSLAFESLKYLVEAISAMPDMGGVKSWFEGDQSLAKLTKGLNEFGEEYKKFAEQIEGMEKYEASVRSAFGSLGVLGEALQKLPLQNEMITAMFGGSTTLAQVGEGLAAFGPSFVTFSSQMQGISNFDSVDHAFESLGVLGEALKKFPTTGGFLNAIFGEKKTLGDVGYELGKFGPYMKVFAKQMALIDDFDVVDRAFASLGVLVTAMSDLPDTGGLWQMFTGEKSLADLGSGLSEYGTGLRTFYGTIKGIGMDGLDLVAKAGDITNSFATAMNTIPGDKLDFIEWFTGDKSLATFGEGLVAYGGSIVEYSEKLGGFKFTEAWQGVSITERFIDLANKLQPLGGWAGFWNGEQSLDIFGSHISGLGTGLSEYSENSSGTDWDKIDRSIDTVQKFIDLSKNMLGQDFSGFSDFTDQLNQIAGIGAYSFIQTFEDQWDDAKAAAQGFVTSAVEGLQDADLNAAVESAAKAVGENALLGFNYGNNWGSDYYGQTRVFMIGYNLVQGVINGMASQAYAANVAAYNIGYDIVTSMRNATRVNSPSKATFEIGEYLMEGLVNGMNENLVSATDASTEIGEEVLASMQRAIASVMAIMESDGAVSPVIRPVIDLSDAEKQAGQINGLFGNQIVAGTGFSTAAGLNRTIQNGSGNGGYTNNTTNNSASININVYGGKGQDANAIANEVQKRLKASLDQRGYAFR